MVPDFLASIVAQPIDGSTRVQLSPLGDALPEDPGAVYGDPGEYLRRQYLSTIPAAPGGAPGATAAHSLPPVPVTADRYSVVELVLFLLLLAGAAEIARPGGAGSLSRWQ